MTYEDIIEAQYYIVEHWGESGKRVVLASRIVSDYYGITLTDFLKHCTACGGNWCGMILSGIRELWPFVWDAIPDDMGVFAFQCLCKTLILCGVDTSK